MFDKAKLEALRAKYIGAKETEVAPAGFRNALTLVFGASYRRSMPYAGLSTLLDRVALTKLMCCQANAENRQTPIANRDNEGFPNVSNHFLTLEA